MLARAAKEALKVFWPNSTRETEAINGKERRRNEQMPFGLPVFNDKIPPQLHVPDLAREASIRGIHATSSRERTTTELVNTALDNRKDMAMIRKTISLNRKGELMKADTRLQGLKLLNSMKDRIRINSRLVRRGTRFSTPFRIAGEVSLPSTSKAIPSVRVPGGHNSMTTIRS